MTWSPLACGLITGKYSDGVPECSRAAMKVSLIFHFFWLHISLTIVLDFIGIQCESVLFSMLVLMKGYQWLKERVNSEEGRRQLAKIKELHLLADRLGCTAAQLAIGMIRANGLHFLVQTYRDAALLVFASCDCRLRLNWFVFAWFSLLKWLIHYV